MSRMNEAALEIGVLVGSGRMADVHRYGDHAIKLYKPGYGKAEAFVEAAHLALLERHGLPTPRVHRAADFDGRWGLVMDRVEGETLGSVALADAARAPACLEEMVRLQLQLHAVTETRFRPFRARLATSIAHAAQLDAPLREDLRQRLAALPDGDRICHGDLHPLNIIGEPGGATIIDWLDATSGPPAADACRSYLLLRLAAPQVAEPYLELYVARSGTARPSILAWLPIVAAARLAEGVEGEDQFLIELARAA